MIANVYSNGKHTRLAISVPDIEELIMRCGWTVTNDCEDVTPEERDEIGRLDARGWVGGDLDRSMDEALSWWRSRVLSERPALTPDM